MQRTSQGRWAGRHVDKDLLRAEVWTMLETSGASVGPAWSRIPDFVGADQAAERLASLPAWSAAGVIKCNPDPAQAPVRLRALQDGKLLYAPVPELSTGIPFVRIDPARLSAAGVPFALAATAKGFLAHGEPVAFEDMPFLPFCVVGCVAVTRTGGRTGKGAGFADLELGILSDLGKVDATTRIVTTVHSSQVVADGRVVMQPHDAVLHVIATEAERIDTGAGDRKPPGVDWRAVQPDQFDAIPFLSDLRRRMTDRPLTPGR